jgi:methylated-DNA-[protein]-cysteine S-methyltransferase
MELLLDRVASPIGTITIISDGALLRALEFEDYEDRMRRLLRIHVGDYTTKESRNPGGVSDRMRAYFAGDLAAIEDIAVETGGTPFQREVWTALRLIPAGSTTSYGELAKTIGRPNAVRAVGMANGSNPIPIVVPCHRVIGSDGTLTGYGGGLPRKRWLLAHEGVVPYQRELSGAMTKRVAASD